MTNHVFELIEKAALERQIPWWEWQIPTNVVVTSPLKPAMLGFDPDEFAGAGYQAYVNLLHPDDYERTMDAMRAHFARTARLYEIDYRIRRKDGEYTWYMDRGAIIERDADGQPLRLRGIVLDLGTQLREHLHEEAIVAAVRTSLPGGGAERPVVLCAQCGRMPFGRDQWSRVDRSFAAGFPGQVSHSLCPECIATLYPAVADSVNRRLGRY